MPNEARGTVGLGVDLVHIPGFIDQLDAPGTRFAEVFASAERRAARRRAAATGNHQGHHLAARWAGKEAFIKAWSAALVGQPPVLPPESVNMSEVRIMADAWDRPYVELDGDVASAFATSVPGMRPVISLSHDADYAIAVCQLVPSHP
ncbi:holo-ACP synthase AcpS [Trueperella bialowiezensis]|uniref:Holo-[acyl-carrier-protein] synthase n=1 Tax=Trueperella bialowiezensis TaxID=312285 RepID=A0A3S4Z694_9ACTO|nr:holo-ACP synthase [Trueperella bialowiezensis]VEI13919.1 Holo-[acyl-carrier-protein] synthase [Trueperella bialowiezensis]